MRVFSRVYHDLFHCFLYCSVLCTTLLKETYSLFINVQLFFFFYIFTFSHWSLHFLISFIDYCSKFSTVFSALIGHDCYWQRWTHHTYHSYIRPTHILWYFENSTIIWARETIIYTPPNEKCTKFISKLASFLFCLR